MGDPLRPSLDEALAEWSRRVRENREQVERVREVEDGSDFYAPVAHMFRADPHRQDEPALNALRELVRPEDTWLDIGAGGGRYALPIALLAREVIALEPSEGMLGILKQGMDEHGMHNVRLVPSRWPAEVMLTADVSLMSHVGYDIEDIGPFLDAMEAATRRRCVTVMLHRPPSSGFDRLWPEVHREARAALPSLPEFIALQLARGRVFDIRLTERTPQSFDSAEQAINVARRQTWVRPGSNKDRRLQRYVESQLKERGGRYALDWEPSPVGIVSWAP